MLRGSREAPTTAIERGSKKGRNEAAEGRGIFLSCSRNESTVGVMWAYLPGEVPSRTSPQGLPSALLGGPPSLLGDRGQDVGAGDDPAGPVVLLDHDEAVDGGSSHLLGQF